MSSLLRFGRALIVVRPPLARAARALPLPSLRNVWLPRRSTSSGTAEGQIAGAAAAQKNRRVVGYWVMGTAGMVFVMVVLGGVTRLTKSGLSIVEWKAHGEPLPRTSADWEAAFDRYKAFPEFLKVNRHMTVDEFKFIYLMEWFHRFWGRAIGVGFAGPLLYFAVRRQIPPGLWPRLLTLLGIGGAQGAVGWWMVKSGLEHERFADNHAIPRVSPYRLATHLGFAFAVYSLLVWTGLDLLAAPLALAQAAGPGAVTAAGAAATRRLAPAAYLASALVAVTAASGAFVAGNDAGHAYNDWPLMAGVYVPEQIWDPALGARNLFENTATVQFDHRQLAYATLAAVGAAHVAAKRAGGRAVVPMPVRHGLIALAALVAAQAALGIATLMLYVPVPLAAAHQAGALGLLTGAVYLAHTVRRVAKAAVAGGGVAKGRATAAAAAATTLACAALLPRGDTDAAANDA